MWHNENHHYVQRLLAKIEWCYIFDDTKLNEYIHSGKASRESGNSFPQRLDNHQKGSCLKTQEHRDSLFYLLHATGKMGLKGKHEWLKTHCALGFDSNKHSAINIINYDDYFNYESAKSCLNNANLRNESITTAKNPLFPIWFNTVVT